MQVITNAAFEAARQHYTRFALVAAAHLAKEVGFSYDAVDFAPSTAAEVQAVYHVSMTDRCAFPVWNGASENTVFTCKEGNWAFRFWHDVVSHGAHGLGFDTKDELKAGMQWVERVAREFGATSIEAMIAYADTCGQSLYCEQHGEFPEDQIGFVRHYLNVGDAHGTIVDLEMQSQAAALAA